MIMEEMVLISKFKVSSKNNITYLFNEFNGDIFFLTTELYTYIKNIILNLYLVIHLY